VLDRHPNIDFVFRSHSSANGRLCYEVTDDPQTPVDDPDVYVSTFATFVRTTGARWAIPLASNHCFLHRDVFDLNHTVTTPDRVARHFEAHSLTYPRVKVMIPGDRWSSDEGFQVDPDGDRWFSERDARLLDYRDRMQPKLDAFYTREDRTRVTLSFVQRWLDTFHAALPAPVRLLFRGHPVTFFLRHGGGQTLFRLDLHTGQAEQLTAPDRSSPTLEVHTGALIFKQCCALDLFSHLQISKRVKFVVTRHTRWRMELLNHLWELYDYDYLPVEDIDWPRMVQTWSLRWREVALWSRVAADLAAGRGFDQAAWIRAARPELTA
jgi:UDP-MurNAc hydroxylase